MKQLQKFIKDQLSVWPLAAANFRALKTVKTKTLEVCGQQVKVQFNPSRVASSTADTSPEVIAARPCFLCVPNRPPEQFHIKFEGRKGRQYNVQVNPFPIFREHLVIARDTHIPQVIWHHLPDMMDFARKYPDFVVFYNGPESGASAPDHLHFQACPRKLMPIEVAVDAFLDDPGEPMAVNKDAGLYHYTGYCRGVFALKAGTSKSLAKLFYRLLCCCAAEEMVTEPPFNLFTWYRDGEYRCLVFLRGAVRSHHYFSDGPDHSSISPGAADMAGVFVAPFEEDFQKADSRLLEEMLDEVTISREEEDTVIRRLTRKSEKIEVGIMTAKEIVFEIISDGAGPQKVSWCDGRIAYNGALYDELYFDSVTRSTLFAEPTFILRDVKIGIGFHWEQNRTLKYAGSLRFIVEGDAITAINTLSLENYLLSVISSEMKSTAGLELLKAHAVISRSWVVARMRERRNGGPVEPAHRRFDVCADDHCQRYQGLTMAIGGECRRAIDETWGQVLTYAGELCDTRYSKCCGGRTERFSACWEDKDFHYLQSVEDPWCDCENSEILSQVLNDYDLKTKDFHDWTVRESAARLGELVSRYTGKDIGEAVSLEPLERGDSGRIMRLRVKGSRGEAVIGKELAIRKALSPDCLKSSAFEAERDGDSFILRGKGWGHGVGLCQIGAAVMAANGFSYREILAHYYKDSVISDIGNGQQG